MALTQLGPLSINQVIHAPSTDGVASVVLTSGISTQVSIPVGAKIAAFAFNADIWVTYGASTGSISPSSGSSAGSTASAEFNPTIRYLPGNTTGINICSDFTCKGTVSFYA